MSYIRNLNKLEFSILYEIALKYPLISPHLNFLRVKSIENTGVGMYVNFYYLNNEDLVDVNPPNATLSINSIIKLNNLKNGLGFVVDVSDGKLNYIELFTYGNETWDGSFTKFHFEGI